MAGTVRLVIFTDLDGTLVDYPGYSFEKAKPALSVLREKGIPLVICSSKTSAEVLLYRERLENQHPFIVENGGGIFIPDGYFSSGPPEGARHEAGFDVVKLGEWYGRLRLALAELRRDGFDVTGFGDMTKDEISRLTGLSASETALAAQREFDEPFVFKGGEVERASMKGRIEAMGLRYTEGRLCHIMGNSDKGRALLKLKELFIMDAGQVVTAALGDSLNDLEMLREADYPFLVRNPDGIHDERVSFDGLRKVDGTGPEGWNTAVLALTEELGL